MSQRLEPVRASALRRRLLACAAGALASFGPARFAPASAQTTAKTVTVQIRDYKYLPPHLSITVGTRVRWVNAEKRTAHNVRFAGPEIIESDLLFPGDSYERLFDKPGVYSYLCGPHPEMLGTIEVKP